MTVEILKRSDDRGGSVLPERLRKRLKHPYSLWEPTLDLQFRYITRTSSSSLQSNYQVFKLHMSLPPGNYNIRWAPRDPPPPGGLYATSEGIEAQIAAKALGPHPIDQNWTITRVDGGGPQEYFITLAQLGAPRAGWVPIGEGTDIPLILTDGFERWNITPVDPENSIYRITEAGIFIGVIKAVAEQHGRLVVKTYPVGADIPQWQITPSGIIN